MAHLIETIKDKPIEDAIESLRQAHDLIVDQAIQAEKKIGIRGDSWGLEFKRLDVALPKGESLVGKGSEKFVEIINILATTERTISALVWLAHAYPNAVVRECHASTSNDHEGNDIVLVEESSRRVLVRCEVTDVISSSAGQNGKEKKDIKNLGCASSVPDDGAVRYIATSFEFSQALASKSRKWGNMHYRYVPHDTECSNQTVMLEVVKAH